MRAQAGQRAPGSIKSVAGQQDDPGAHAALPSHGSATPDSARSALLTLIGGMAVCLPLHPALGG